MTELDRLDYGDVRDSKPDHYHKADLLASTVVSDDPGRYVVSRGESDSSHVVELATWSGEWWGACSCDGYAYNDGPCSHLCLLHRLERRDLLDVPQATVHGIQCDVHGRQQEIADHVDATAATDGGVRR
jgi:hypothetical protein